LCQIWTPSAEKPSLVAGVAGPETSEVLKAMQGNQRQLSHNREIMLYVYINYIDLNLWNLFMRNLFNFFIP
jgi:hypothetical protein